MVFHELRAIFFHVGKTAGDSIEWMLLPGPRDPCVGDRHLMFGLDSQLGIYLQHATCRTALDIIGPKTFHEYFKFTIVRNPYDRLVSTYFYQIDRHLKEFGSFRNYILSLPERLSDPRARMGSHATSQLHYTHIDDKPVVNFVGRFEELDKAVAIIKDRLGIVADLPRRNVIQHRLRPRGKGHALYDEEMIKVMQTVYRRDFDTYAYPVRPMLGTCHVSDAISRSYQRIMNN
ncbi:MAG: sulfotransferase family 2 domain-containing protein [Hyphomicrobiaceae bacterium]